MTYVSPTYSRPGGDDASDSSEPHRGTAESRGDDPFYMEYGKGGRKIDVSGMAYGDVTSGKSVEDSIGKAGDGGTSDFD